MGKGDLMWPQKICVAGRDNLTTPTEAMFMKNFKIVCKPFSHEYRYHVTFLILGQFFSYPDLELTYVCNVGGMTLQIDSEVFQTLTALMRRQTTLVCCHSGADLQTVTVHSKCGAISALISSIGYNPHVVFMYQ